jgi:hypothetical protein
MWALGVEIQPRLGRFLTIVFEGLPGDKLGSEARIEQEDPVVEDDATTADYIIGGLKRMACRRPGGKWPGQSFSCGSTESMRNHSRSDAARWTGYGLSAIGRRNLPGYHALCARCDDERVKGLKRAR